MSAEYYYAVGTEQKGPFKIEQLAQLNLRPDTLVWREGMPNWQRLDATVELAEALLPPKMPPTVLPPVQPTGQYPQPPVAPQRSASLGYDTTQFGPGGPLPASGASIAALILGIYSFVAACVPYVNVSTLLTSILAIVFGFIGNGQANRREAGGKGMAITGMVLGIVYLVILVVVVIIALIFGLAILGAAATQQGGGR